MKTILHFDINGAGIDVLADIGLDSDGYMVARSKRRCMNRVWTKTNIDDLKNAGEHIVKAYSNIEDLQKNSFTNNDMHKYGIYDTSEEIIKRIQNSLKDTVGDINKHTDDAMNGVLTELKDIHESINLLETNFGRVESQLIDFNIDEDEADDDLDCMDDEYDDEDEDDDGPSYADFFSFEEMMGNYTPSVDDYVDFITKNSRHKKSKEESQDNLNKHEVSNENTSKSDNAKIIDDSDLKFDTTQYHMGINGSLYTYDYINDRILKAIDEQKWRVCAEKNVPKKYRDYIHRTYDIDIRAFASTFSYWITLLDPINEETKLPVHIETTNKLLKKIHEIIYNLYYDDSDDDHIVTMARHELSEFIHSIVFENPETKAYFQVLATTYNEAQKMCNGEKMGPPDFSFGVWFTNIEWKDTAVCLETMAMKIVDCILQYSEYAEEVII